jgi:hypothetical protein
MLGSSASLAARSGRCGNSGAVNQHFPCVIGCAAAWKAADCAQSSEEEEAAATDDAGAAAKAMAVSEWNVAGGSMVETRKHSAAAMGRGRVGCHCLRGARCHGAEAERVATEWSAAAQQLRSKQAESDSRGRRCKQAAGARS